MRLLVTRPEPAASATADRLRALGHAPILSPVTRIEPTGAIIPDARYAAIIATSAAALSGNAALPVRLFEVPMVAVGDATARAARAAGFRHVVTGDGAADGLPALISGLFDPAAGPLLYLAGTPRKPGLERALTGLGYRLTMIERYRAVPADMLTPAAVAALQVGGIDVVLHYSRQSAERFVQLVATAGLAEAAQALPHHCLSGDVAGGLAALAPARLVVAPAPTEAALIGQLDK